jgi:hypothetical protein
MHSVNIKERNLSVIADMSFNPGGGMIGWQLCEIKSWTVGVGMVFRY